MHFPSALVPFNVMTLGASLLALTWASLTLVTGRQKALLKIPLGKQVISGAFLGSVFDGLDMVRKQAFSQIGAVTRGEVLRTLASPSVLLVLLRPIQLLLPTQQLPFNSSTRNLCWVSHARCLVLYPTSNSPSEGGFHRLDAGKILGQRGEVTRSRFYR